MTDDQMTNDSTKQARPSALTEEGYTASSMLRGIAAQGTLRAVAIDGTQIVEKARARHNLSATATTALGRTLMGAALLAAVLGKDAGRRVALRIQGGGPVGWVVAEGTAGGDVDGTYHPGSVRGYVHEPQADLPPRESDGKLDVGGLVGTDGELAVTRLLENAEPWTGSVPLVSGEIADDLTTYLACSEQIPNALLLGVYVEGGRVTAAGGLLVQAMPGVSEETLSRLESNIASTGQLTTSMREVGLLGTVERALEGLDVQLSVDAEPWEFACRCSRERAAASLMFFDDKERREMQEEGGQEVVCHWCNEHYFFGPEEIAALELQPEGEGLKA